MLIFCVFGLLGVRFALPSLFEVDGDYFLLIFGFDLNTLYRVLFGKLSLH